MSTTRKKPTDSDISRVMRELGRRGAAAGHAKRSDAEKKEHASRAAKARWASHVKENKGVKK